MILKDTVSFSGANADSENEIADITPDTDNETIDRIQRNIHGSYSIQRSGPTNGNTNCENQTGKLQMQSGQTKQCYKPISSHPNTNITNTSVEIVHPYSDLQGVTVGALEVQNVKRAINRYGTLPKGARIGQYLESLKASDIDKNAPDLPPPPPSISR